MTPRRTPTPSRSSAIFAAELRQRIKAMAEGIVSHMPWYVDPEDVIQVGVGCALEALPAARGWRWMQLCARRGMRRYIDDERRYRQCVVPLERAHGESTDGVAVTAVGQVAGDAIVAQLDEDAAEICTLKVNGHKTHEVATKQGTHRNTVRNRLNRAGRKLSVDE